MTLEMKYQEKYLKGKEDGKVDGKIEEIVFDGIEDQLPKEKFLQRIMKRVDVDEAQALEYYEFFRKQV